MELGASGAAQLAFGDAKDPFIQRCVCGASASSGGNGGKGLKLTPYSLPTTQDLPGNGPPAR